MNDELRALSMQAHDALMDASQKFELVLLRLESGGRWELDDETTSALQDLLADVDAYADTCRETIDKATRLLTGQADEVLH